MHPDLNAFLEKAFPFPLPSLPSLSRSLPHAAAQRPRRRLLDDRKRHKAKLIRHPPQPLGEARWMRGPERSGGTHSPPLRSTPEGSLWSRSSCFPFGEAFSFCVSLDALALEVFLWKPWEFWLLVLDAWLGRLFSFCFLPPLTSRVPLGFCSLRLSFFRPAWVLPSLSFPGFDLHAYKGEGGLFVFLCFPRCFLRGRPAFLFVRWEKGGSLSFSFFYISFFFLLSLGG